MTEFPSRTLGELAADEPGAIAIGPFGSRMKAEVYVDQGVPVIRGTNIGGDRALKGDWVYVTEAFASDMPNCIVKDGDLVFPHRGSIGEVALIEKKHGHVVLSTSMMKFRPNPTQADSTFLYYFFRSVAGRHEIMRFASQVGTPGIGQPLTSLRQFKVPLPPIHTQLAIAELLASLDDKIELNRQINETLEAMAHAIFRDWFVDFGPTRRKIDGATDPVEVMGGLVNDPDRAQELAALFPARLGDDGLPEGWEERRLDEICSQHTASLAPLSYPDEFFDHYSIPAFDKERSPAAELGAAILSNKTLVPSNAVLLSKLNPEIARVWLPNKDARHREICSTEFLAYTPTEPFGRALIYTLFTSDPFRSLLCGMVTGTSKSHQRVSPKALAQREVLTVGVAEAVQFEAVVQPLLDRILHNRGESRTLAATRDLLLPKLMSGEIRLRDAEREIEAVA